MTVRPRRVLPLLAALALAVPSLAQGQAARYARPVGDTVRYDQSLSMRVDLTILGVRQDVRLEQSGRFAVAFLPGDSAEARYETLEVRQALGEDEPLTPTDEGVAEMMRPLRFAFGDRGPRGSFLVGDLGQGENPLRSGDFADFFPPLPAGALTRGATWADSLDAGELGGTLVRTYTVAGDTTVAGTRLTIIDIALPLSVRKTEQEDEATTTVTMTGSETGRALFDPAAGRLVSMRREGRIEARVAVSDEDMKMEVPMNMRWTLVSDAAPR